MLHEGPRLSRRDALRTIGAGSAAAATAATQSSAAAAGAAPTDAAQQYGWTKAQGHEQPRNGFQEEIYTGHTLTYLNASWDPLGAPAPDDESGVQTDVEGCWRHTFALTGVGAAGNEVYYGRGLPYGAISVNVRPTDADFSHLDTVDAATAAPSATGVSARRNPSLFNFAERHAFESHLEEQGVTAVDVADFDGEQSLHEDVFRAQEFVENETGTDRSIPFSAMATVLGLVPSSDDASDALKKLGKAASAGDVVLNVLDTAFEFYEAFTVETPPRFDRGFAATFPAELYQKEGESVTWPDGSADASSNFKPIRPASDVGAYFGAGTHYLLFDVLEVPSSDHASVVDVASSFDRHSRGQTPGPVAGWSIVLDTPVPQNGDPSEMSPSKRFSATAVQTDRPTRRADSYEVTN